MEVLYSAAKPTGKLTLGNYLGSIKNWKEMQDSYKAIFAIADLHSLTIGIDSKKLKQNIYDEFATFLACGLDPKRSIIYCQSQVKEHASLAWIMNCMTYFGEASRMTQFKEHKAKDKEVSVGLFAYPMLMAADILLYNTNVVPVGIDQKQHVELCRKIAMRFNNRYGKTFVIPKVMIKKDSQKIMGLLDPTHKMTKSGENMGNVIFLDDSDEEILRKFKRAVTDSKNRIKFCEDQPGVSNLLTIYACINDISIGEAEDHFKGKNYSDLKMETAMSTIKLISPIRKKLNSLKKDPAYLEALMKRGAKRAETLAKETLKRVYKAVGLVSL